MEERFKKYFWDGTTGWSKTAQLKRILEAASFPDMIHYPFAEVKAHLHELNLDRLWAGEKRKEFLRKLAPHVGSSQTWEEAIDKMTAPFFKHI